MMVEDIKKDFNNSLKEIQENTAKELQILKEKQENTTKQVEVLIEKQENTSKQVMEMNKTILDLKREVDTIKKTQSEATLEIETRGHLVIHPNADTIVHTSKILLKGPKYGCLL